MAGVAAPRAGVILTVKGRPIPFSFHPVVQTNRRYGLQSRIFSTNPWGIIRQSIEDTLTGVSRDQAIAFLAQAEDFFRSASTSTLITAKPILIYYCFLNLVKAYVLQQRVKTEYSQAQHGIQDALHPAGVEFNDSFLKAFRSKPSAVNIFDDFQEALFKKKFPSSGRVFDLQKLLPQLLQGHRVWCDAAKVNERFVEITRIDYLHEEATKKIWLVINVFEDDLTRFAITRKRMLSESGLDTYFRQVISTEVIAGRKLLKFEQIIPSSYTGRASDKIVDLVNLVRPFVWTTVLIIPPYRKNYVYLCPPADKLNLVEQMLSIYACFYYFGSVTRYRPHLFEPILKGRYGGHIQEIISNIPQQFVYLMASEFSGREVAHAPIV